MRHSVACLAAFVAAGACLQSGDKAPEDWSHLVTDQALSALPDPVYNLTTIRLTDGHVEQVTSEMSARPSFLPDGRLAFNGANNAIRLFPGPTSVEGQTGEIAGTSPGCVLVLTDDQHGLDCIDPVSAARTARHAASTDCMIIAAVAFDASSNTLALTELCGQPLPGASNQGVLRLIREGSTSRAISGANSPDFASDGSVAFVTGKGIEVLGRAEDDPTVVVAGAASTRHAWPTWEGDWIYYVRSQITNVSRMPEGSSGDLDYMEVRRVHVETGTEETILRTREFTISSMDVRPSEVAISILSLNNS